MVGGFPRDRLIPPDAPAALQKGTAAPFAVVLIDGLVGGLWERHVRGNRLEIRVDMFASPSAAQVCEVELQAKRIGAILGLKAELRFAEVQALAHR